jgi:hypothetical protein
VADESSIESYINPGKDFLANPGDNGGFVVLSAGTFNPDENQADSPGYDGTVRVLGSVLWDDVYPGLSLLTVTGKDLWPLAMKHPLQIYVGPLTKCQRQHFSIVNCFRNETIKAALEWKEKTSVVSN